MFPYIEGSLHLRNQDDWPAHKRVCKALRELEDSESTNSLGFYELFCPTTGDSFNATELYKFSNACHHADMHDYEQIVGRPVTTPEHNLFGWEPRCAACGVTDRMLRMQAKEQRNGPAAQLQTCADCHTTFFCSTRHWALVMNTHSNAPCAILDNNMSQCRINRQIREDIRLAKWLADAKASFGDPANQGGNLRWAPERTMGGWRSVSGKTWEEEFLEDLIKDHPLAQGPLTTPFVRVASDGLTLPMTILYALEKLARDDLAFTNKEVIRIHVLGASGPELQNSMVFEEILHRIPKAKKLELLLCGPGMDRVNHTDRPGGIVMDMGTCPDCQVNKRSRVQILTSQLYHDFVRESGAAFIIPDLAIAFNSGSSEVETESWQPTIKLLVERRIPSVFTSFNREEAEGDAALLTKVGAQLIPSLGPCPNPWGSMSLRIEPGFGRADGFFNSNGWFAAHHQVPSSPHRGQSRRISIEVSQSALEDWHLRYHDFVSSPAFLGQLLFLQAAGN
ncbi:hypothetical protein NMY22_g17664 [Coprinellus aureogranulatus]|nr:hypothetical protein NMY22_g17664 [Coprinellus aureogranulatus]